MTAQQVRDCFAPNWVFGLYRRAHPLLIVVGIPVAVFLVGCAVALPLGVFDLFARSLLAYPFGIGFGLAAYIWFAENFPRMIESVSTAFECAQGEQEQIIRKWAQRLGNRNWLMVVVGAAIGASMLPNLLNLWSSPNTAWMGQAWAQSDLQRGFPFFALYYGFNDVIAGGFLFGSGAVGLLTTVLLVYELLNLPLKLAHSRKLMAICNLGLWLAIWTLVGFAFILPIKVLSTNQLARTGDIRSVALTTLVLSIIDFGALALAFGVPIIVVRQAIIRAKSRQMESLLNMQDSIFQTIERLQRGEAATAGPKDAYAMRTQLKAALTEHYDMEELRTLCFDLHVNYENIQRETKDATVRELILHFERHGGADQLREAISRERQIDWTQLPQPDVHAQLETANQEYELTQKMIAEIEAIPTWPVTVRRIVEATVFCGLSVGSGVGWTYLSDNFVKK